MVLGAGELPKAEGSEHGHVLLEVLDDDLDVVDLRDHGQWLSLLNRRLLCASARVQGDRSLDGSSHVLAAHAHEAAARRVL